MVNHNLIIAISLDNEIEKPKLLRQCDQIRQSSQISDQKRRDPSSWTSTSWSIFVCGCRFCIISNTKCCFQRTRALIIQFFPLLGYLQMKYNSLNKHVQVIHNWHDAPVRVNLKKYWKKNPLDYIQPTKQYSQKNKITYSKRIINDFVEVVNNRQEMVNGIVQSANHFLKASSKIQDCFAQYYAPECHFQEELDRVLDTVKPEFRYIKAIAHQNLRKIHCLLKKQKQEIKQQEQHSKVLTKKDKLFLLSDPKNADILKSDSRQSRAETIVVTPGEDKFTSQYKIMIQKQHLREQEKQNRIQVRLFDSQLKYQGDDYVKQNIFKTNMKLTYTPKSQDNIMKVRNSTQESVVYGTPSHYKTAVQSRQYSNYEMLPDSIKEEQETKGLYKKRSYRSFKDLLHPHENKYLRTQSQPMISEF